MIRLTLLLMATSVGSLFIGVDEATDRIADTWIEEANGRGINLGYTETGRNGAKAGAIMLLIIGWIVTILVVVQVLTWL
jgi:hypothetical protein